MRPFAYAAHANLLAWPPCGLRRRDDVPMMRDADRSLVLRRVLYGHGSSGRSGLRIRSLCRSGFSGRLAQ